MTYALLAALWNGALLANPDGIQDDPQSLVVKVKGVVCSFCAYGTEKNLARLEFLDGARYGDGVLIDIDTHQVTLALSPGAPVDYARITDAITRGGYDPVAYRLAIRGELHERGDQMSITSADTGQVYLLPEDAEIGSVAGETVQCRAELGPESAAAYRPGHPIRLDQAVIVTPGQ